MSISGEQVTVDDTAGGTELHTSNTGVSGTKMFLRNAGPNEVFLGAAGVTIASGFMLDPLKQLRGELAAGDQLFGICDTGLTSVVHMLKTGE